MLGRGYRLCDERQHVHSWHVKCHPVSLVAFWSCIVQHLNVSIETLKRSRLPRCRPSSDPTFVPIFFFCSFLFSVISLPLLLRSYRNLCPLTTDHPQTSPHYFIPHPTVKFSLLLLLSTTLHPNIIPQNADSPLAFQLRQPSNLQYLSQNRKSPRRPCRRYSSLRSWMELHPPPLLRKIAIFSREWLLKWSPRRVYFFTLGTPPDPPRHTVALLCAMSAHCTADDFSFSSFYCPCIPSALARLCSSHECRG